MRVDDVFCAVSFEWYDVYLLCLCSHGFVVDCGKPSVVAIFLLPMQLTPKVHVRRGPCRTQKSCKDKCGCGAHMMFCIYYFQSGSNFSS